MLAPSPQVTTPTWPIAGDVPDLLAIVNDQAEVVSAQEALLNAYQTNLNAVQFPPPGAAASATGNPTSGATTSITVGGVSGGAIVNGATVTGTTNATAPIVLGQISGSTGGGGTYLLNSAVNLLTSTPLQFIPPSPPSTWPIPQDPATLDQIVQTQTAIIRVQTSLIQHYQDLLNQSQVAAPPTGP